MWHFIYFIAMMDLHESICRINDCEAWYVYRESTLTLTFISDHAIVESISEKTSFENFWT